MYFASGAGIHLREKNIAGQTERSQNAQHFASSQGRDLRFSMKMMHAPILYFNTVCMNCHVVPIITRIS